MSHHLAPKLAHKLLLLLLTVIVCSSIQAAQPLAATCRLSITGSRLGIADAQLACTGGTVRFAANPLLQRYIKGAPGVLLDPDGCTAGGCLLTVCGGSNVRFTSPTIGNLRLAPSFNSSVVCISGNSSATITNASLVNNEACLIQVTDSSSLNLINSTVSDNLCAQEAQQAGVRAVDSAYVSIQGCRFINNTHSSSFGGAVRASFNATIAIASTQFHKNRVSCPSCWGGAVSAHSHCTGAVWGEEGGRVRTACLCSPALFHHHQACSNKGLTCACLFAVLLCLFVSPVPSQSASLAAISLTMRAQALAVRYMLKAARASQCRTANSKTTVHS